MKKRIYINMFLLTFVGVIFTVALFIFSFYNMIQTQMKSDIESKANIFEYSLNYYTDYLHNLRLTDNNERLSIIADNGEFIFDSIDIESPENHFDTPEVKEAFVNGRGDFKRLSNSLREETYYYAVKLSDGTVLRLSKTTNSILGAFIEVTPLIFVVLFASFALCYFFAIRLTNKIIEPISKINFNNESSFIYDELSVFIKTITIQREQINKQIISLEDRSNTINTIIENMCEGLILLNQNGFILSANKSATGLFDNLNNDYTGKYILELTRNVDLMNGIKSVYSGKRSDTILSLNTKVVQVFINPVMQNDEISGAIVLFLDITEKSYAEKMRSEFSANVSHELKTPLTTIYGLSEMIDNGMVKYGDIKQFAGKIRKETSRLIKLIEDIIMLSELDEASEQKQYEQFDLLVLTNEVAENLKQIADGKKVKVKIIGESFPVIANRRMIDELLFNLIENGIKYNQNNGSVIVSLINENNNLKLRIKDTGIGIPKEHIDRIFERFYRVEKSRSKRTGGTGLGLSIVKHIVQYHDWNMNIESQVNVGTTIDINLLWLFASNSTSGTFLNLHR